MALAPKHLTAVATKAQVVFGKKQAPFLSLNSLISKAFVTGTDLKETNSHHHMAHDVFISYSSQDKAVADAVCTALEASEAKIRCWIAPRDVMPGADYGEAIVRAINECKVMVLVFSAMANASKDIGSEVHLAFNKGRPIIPLRIEDVRPEGAMEYRLGQTHWLDAMTKPVESHLGRLVEVVASLLGAGEITPVRVKTAPACPSALPTGFEYRSELHVFGYPILHIAIGLPNVDGRSQHARGLIAIGDNPIGVVAIGTFARGVFALGTLPIGVFPVGLIAFGCFSVGAFAFGLVGAWGLVAIAPVAVGAVALGYYNASEFSVGRFVYNDTAPDPEAVRFFEPWLKSWIHVTLASLCFLSYLAPRMIKGLKWVASGKRSNGKRSAIPS